MIQRKGRINTFMDWQWITSVVCILVGIFFIMTKQVNLKWDDSRIYRRKSGEYDLAYQTYNLMLGLVVYK